MDNKDYFRDMNNILNEWQGQKPSEIRNVERELKKFYKDIGKNVKNPTKFNNRVKLTPEQEQELIDIALSLDAVSTDLEYYEDLFKREKDKRGWKSIDDVTEFIEQMNGYKSDALLREIISSEQIIELYSQTKAYGINSNDVENMLVTEYTMTGKTFDNLYEQVLTSLDEIAETSGEDGNSYLMAKWATKKSGR